MKMKRVDLPAGFKSVTCDCGSRVDLGHTRVERGKRTGICIACNKRYASPVEDKKP